MEDLIMIAGLAGLVILVVSRYIARVEVNVLRQGLATADKRNEDLARGFDTASARIENYEAFVGMFSEEAMVGALRGLAREVYNSEIAHKNKTAGLTQKFVNTVQSLKKVGFNGLSENYQDYLANLRPKAKRVQEDILCGADPDMSGMAIRKPPRPNPMKLPDPGQFLPAPSLKVVKKPKEEDRTSLNDV